MISEYRKRLGGSALVLYDENLAEMKDYRIENLKNNHLTGILPLTTGSEDGSFKLFYEVSGKQPVTTVFAKKKLEREDIALIIRGICNVLDVTQEYLLEPEGLIFDPDYIFIAGENEVDFVYYPDRDTGLSAALHELGEYFINRVDHSDPRAVKLAYGFFEMTGKDEIMPDEIKRLCASKLVQNMAPKPVMPSPSGPVLSSAPKTVQPPLPKPEPEKEPIKPAVPDLPKKSKHEKAEFKNPKKKSIVDYLIWIVTSGVIIWLIYDNFLKRMGNRGIIIAALLGVLAIDIIVTCIVKSRRKNKEPKITGEGSKLERQRTETAKKKEMPVMPEPVPVRKPRSEYMGTGILRDDSDKTGILRDTYEKTGLLSEHEHQTLGLIPAFGNNKKPLFLTGFPFVVGKSLSYADGAIDDAYISRVHCRFTRDGDSIRVADLCSTNSTYLNGTALDPNVEYEIHEGDEIKLGRAAYVFSMVEC